jgi:hypothetical protein
MGNIEGKIGQLTVRRTSSFIMTSLYKKRSKKMNESSGELSEISDQLSDITEIISDIGTDESDVDTEEDIQPAPGRNAYPWFSVIDRETFQLSVEGFVAGKHWTYGI